MRMEKSMSLYNGEKKIQADGVGTVTTHRLLWMHETAPEGATSGKLSMPLREVRSKTEALSIHLTSTLDPGPSTISIVFQYGSLQKTAN